MIPEHLMARIERPFFSKRKLCKTSRSSEDWEKEDSEKYISSDKKQPFQEL